MIVAHDPGHGCSVNGKQDNGCEHNGIVELHYTLEVANDVAGGVPWVQHVLLRTSNESPCPAYRDRAKAAKDIGAKLVLCHHVNAADDGARGLITFFDPDDAVGKEAATAIARAAPHKLRRQANAVIPVAPDDWTSRAHWVLNHYWSLGLPAVLIEWGFTTNLDDVAALLNPATRASMVVAAAAGIARAMELTHERRVA